MKPKVLGQYCVVVGLLACTNLSWAQDGAAGKQLAAPRALAPSVEAQPTTNDPEAAKLTWSGRIFVGDTASRTKVGGQRFWRNEMAVRSARLGFKFSHPDGLSTVIKLEVSDGKADLKDGFIQLQASPSIRVQAGRFKKPISGIALASKWELPSIERGLLNDLAVEEQDLPFAGSRGDGLLLRYKPLQRSKPELVAALFQNSLGTGAVSLDAKDNFTQDLFVRASVAPMKGLRLASSFALLGYLGMRGDRDSFSHAKVVSLEASYEGRYLQAWWEGFAGQSMFAKVDGSTASSFIATRVLVAPRLRPGVPRRVTPFVGASYFDPRTSEENNANSEVQVGAKVGFAKRWRLQVEASQIFAEGIFASAIESTVFRIQLGAKFKE